MSRTHKDEPFWIREFRNDPNWGYIPDDWRERTNWRHSPSPRYDYDAYFEWRENLPSSRGSKRYANWADSSPGFSAFRKDLNRSYRRKAKLKIQACRYDEIDRPRRNARWLWW